MLICPHPCNFRPVQWRDNGWGDMAFCYSWDATVGDCAGLERCVLFEVTRYAGSGGRDLDGWYYPPDPPFVGWRFRNPTDGRTAPVGMECFSASIGRAWDRHKRVGRLVVPVDTATGFFISAHQEYWFRCELCGGEERLCTPHPIERRFVPLGLKDGLQDKGLAVWRYSLKKHGFEAYLDMTSNGYVGDSANIGFGPWESDALNDQDEESEGAIG